MIVVYLLQLNLLVCSEETSESDSDWYVSGGWGFRCSRFVMRITWGRTRVASRAWITSSGSGGVVIGPKTIAARGLKWNERNVNEKKNIERK